LTEIAYGIQCFEQSDSRIFNFTLNNTIKIDTINPTITTTLVDGAVFNRSNVLFSVTATDSNLAAIRVLGTLNGTNEQIHSVDLTAISGSASLINFTNVNEGRYNVSFFANDSSGRTFITGNITIIVDLTFPDITNLANESIPRDCKARRLTWTTNESTNFTIYIDTDTDTAVSSADGIIATNVTKGTSHQFDFNFGDRMEVQHFINITSCDEADNCNTSNQFTYDTPLSVCAGWSQYALREAMINLSEIQNQSGADLVYVWNHTPHEFIFLTAGLTTNADVIAGRTTDLQVVHLFENTNSTWYRNQTFDPIAEHHINVSGGSNFISIDRLYDFGNLTWSFLNTSKNFPSFINTTQSLNVTFGPFNWSFFAGYNNSNQDYVSHVFNFTWANATFVQPINFRTENPTSMETVWVGGGFNMTWNQTQMIANWTI